MDKIYVVYWSQTGNTEAMAEAVARGIRSEGKESAVVEVGSISPEELKEEAVFALGCPAMGAEVLEESEMEPFVETLEAFVKGKTVGLFGSYGWGDGELSLIHISEFLGSWHPGQSKTTEIEK